MSVDRKAAPSGDGPALEADFHELRRSLSDRAFERLARRPSTPHAILLASAGLLLTVYLIAKAGDLGSIGQVFTAGSRRIWGFFAFTNLYVLLKGLGLRRAAVSCDVKTSAFRATRTFCESSVVGLVVAKIASDVYKFLRIGEGTRGAKIRAVLVYRAASIISVLLLYSLVSVLWAESISWKSPLVWGVPLVVVGGIIALFRTRIRNWIREHGRILIRVLPYSLGALGAKIGGLAVLLGLSLEADLVDVATAFLLIGSLASMTQVPSGVGLLEAGYAVFLTKYAGATGAEAATILICFRLLGPMYTAGLGVLSMGGDVLRRVRETAALEPELEPKTA